MYIKFHPRCKRRNLSTNHTRYTISSFMRMIGAVLLLATLLFTQMAGATVKDLPESVQAFYLVVDDLRKADQRPMGISAADNRARIQPIMQRIVAAGAKTDRKELNLIYPGLGDHLLDDAVAHAEAMARVLGGSGAEDDFNAGIAAIIRWQKWWNENSKKAGMALVNRFG